MTQATDMERQFQERIARAKEAARLASIAAMSRPSFVASAAPMASPAVLDPPPPRHLSPPPPRPVVAFPPMAVPEAVRQRIDRLIEFIARNGAVFEDTVRERERHNPEFAFLAPGAPFHDYFVWKKSQLNSPTAAHAPPPPPPVGFSVPMPPHVMARPAPRPLMAPPHVVSRPQPSPLQPLEDPIFSVSVGAMANAIRAAKTRSLPAYAAIPPDLLIESSVLARGVPPIEPARLETRLAEFYRTSLSPP